MPNTDNPRGFWPVRHLSGGLIRNSMYPIATGYATSIFTGDAVKLVAGGGIEAAAAGDRILGVFAGVKYTNSAGAPVFSPYWPASTTATNIEALVYDDPNIVFGVQQATGGSAAAADVGLLGDHVAGAGSTVDGESGHELSGTIATSAAGFRILGKIEDPNNAWGENVNLEVVIYEHEFSRVDPATPGV